MSETKIIRGGSWIVGSRSGRSTYRIDTFTDVGRFDFGLRVVKEKTKP